MKNIKKTIKYPIVGITLFCLLPLIAFGIALSGYANTFVIAATILMRISAIPAIGVIIHKLIKYNKETLAQENPIENISKEPQETIEKIWGMQ